MKNTTFQETKNGLLFMLPLAALVSLFMIFPILGTIVISFFQDVAFLQNKFIGFHNYVYLLTDSEFWQAVRFTLIFIALSVSLEIIFGLFFALILHENLPWRGFLRVAILIPWAIPSAVSARTWELIYNYHYGLANFLLTRLPFSLEPVNWLGTSTGAFFSILAADVWKTTPFVAIILLAGLQAIPQELYQQAKIDKAGLFQRFSRITLPLLRPILIVALLFRTIDALRIFDLIYVLTHGGPGGATTSLSLYGYNSFLMTDFGYGSAVSVVLFVIALTLSFLYVKVGRLSTETP